MSGIILDPIHGVNPHLTFCPRCGGEGPDLMLIGNRTRIDTCPHCKTVVYGGVDLVKGCPKCKAKRHQGESWQTGRIQEGDKLPGSLCASCEKEQKEHAEAVKAGGIYFRCTACGKTGVVKNNDNTRELCARVRHKLNVPDGEPCGIEFDKCEQHGEGQPLP